MYDDVQVIPVSAFYVEWCAVAPLQLNDLPALLELVKEVVLVVKSQAKGEEDTVQLKDA